MTLAHFAALVRRGRRTKRHEPMLQLRSLKAQDLKYQGLSSQVMHARPSSESPRYLWIWTLRDIYMYIYTYTRVYIYIHTDKHGCIYAPVFLGPTDLYPLGSGMRPHRLKEKCFRGSGLRGFRCLDSKSSKSGVINTSTRHLNEVVAVASYASTR